MTDARRPLGQAAEEAAARFLRGAGLVVVERNVRFHEGEIDLVCREAVVGVFVQVDVFTDRVFGGNPLAVFLDGRGLSDDEMQAIAREMNLSETTFVLPATRPDCAARVRIFTPAAELPFAGHPTVGTAWVLATRGRLGGRARAALEEGIGPVAVELEGEPARPTFVWMSHRDAEFGPPVSDRAGVAAALRLEPGTLPPSR